MQIEEIEHIIMASFMGNKVSRADAMDFLQTTGEDDGDFAARHGETLDRVVEAKRSLAWKIATGQAWISNKAWVC